LWYLMTDLLYYFREFSNPTRKVKERQQEFSYFEIYLKLQLIILDKQGN